MYLLIDLYDGLSRVIDSDEAKEYKGGIQVTKGDKNVWQGEEHLLVQL